MSGACFALLVLAVPLLEAGPVEGGPVNPVAAAHDAALESATRAYQEGRHGAVVEHVRAALRLHPSGEKYRLLAHVLHDRLDRPAEACAVYVECQAQATLDAERAACRAGADRVCEQTARWPWYVVAAGSAITLAGVVTGVAAATEADAYARRGDLYVRRQHQARAQQLGTATDVLLPLGLTTLATGAGLLLYDYFDRPERGPSLRIGGDPTGARLLLEGRF